MTLADQIRKYVRDQIIEPARKQGMTLIKVRAGDVHEGMGLINHLPAFCSALDADKLHLYARVRLIQRAGPTQGSNAEWTFGLQ